MADGTMREYKKGCYQLSFELIESDKDIIKEFCNDINSTYPISINKNSISPNNRARLHIANYTFCQHLLRHGIIPHKTGKEKIPDTVPSQYIKDFIRGYFDGDGCVRFYNKTTTTCMGKFHMVSCSYTILNDLFSILPAIFSKKSLHLKSKSNHIYELETANLVNIAKIYDYLYYDGCICLKRKENIFIDFIKYYKKSKRLIKRYSPKH